MKTRLLTILSAAAMAACPVACTSCSPALNSALSGVISSGLTGQPIPSTAVQRTGHDTAPVVLISSADLALAEQGDPLAVHGLYDAGFLAKRAREVVIESTK